MVNKLWEIISKYPFGSILGLIGLLVAIWQLLIARSTFFITKEELKKKNANFEVYLEEIIRVSVKTGDEVKRILMLNVSIKNKSTTSNTVEFNMEVHFTDLKGLKRFVKLKPIIGFEKYLPANDMKILGQNCRLEGKDIKNGWIGFNFSNSLYQETISHYVLIVIDSDSYFVKLNSILVTDILYEV